MKISFCLTLAFALASILLFLPPETFALNPPPGGGYPNEVTALGNDALFNLNPGSTDNTAIGFEALYNASTASGNTAVGSQAMFSDSTGGDDVAVGFFALNHNTTGTFNVAIGNDALIANTTGGENTAIGCDALEAGTTAIQNTAIGYGAMADDQTGSSNTVVGLDAFAFNVSGSKNAVFGDGAMNNGSGSYNVALGYFAGYNVTGDSNIIIGSNSGLNLTKGDNNIEIGNQGTKTDANLIRIGDIATQKKTFIAGISGATISNGAAVMVNNKGQLGVATSSARFKDDIQPMKGASDVLLSLQPVTFHYRKELDSSGTPQFGLVAEQVAKIDPDLVARDDSGQPYTVRYEAVNAMLLNEILKEHREGRGTGREDRVARRRGGEAGGDGRESEYAAGSGARRRQPQRLG
jgi:hypothetical protein